MHVFAKEFDEALVLKLCGRLHSRTAPMLLDEVLPHTEDSDKTIILDLENLYSLNSAGFHSLHMLACKLDDANRRMLFSSCPPGMEDRLHCARLCDCVAIYPSLEDALTSLQS
ncbi:MAG: STAS domain-containing protein [Pseudomonadota bacterium]